MIIFQLLPNHGLTQINAGNLISLQKIGQQIAPNVGPYHLYHYRYLHCECYHRNHNVGRNMMAFFFQAVDGENHLPLVPVDSAPSSSLFQSPSISVVIIT